MGRRCERFSRMAPPNDQLMRYATQMAEGLAKAHQAGIVHRDFKPENVIISEDGYVKILDFGLAKLSAHGAVGSEIATAVKGATTPGTILGTVGYMSPEQAKGESADFRSDQFSLGAVLYEMVTGRPAFHRATPAETLSAVLRDDPLAGLTTRPELADTLRRCLAKTPGERFASTMEITARIRGAARADTAREAPFRSIAVLPLKNLSADPDQEFFADGMTDALITALAKLGELKVISRSSSMQFKRTDKPMTQIADALGVEAVIEGSVLRAGERVRISAQLIDATADAHLWADSYEGDIRDVLQLQSNVARAIAKEIHVKLERHDGDSPQIAPQVDPEAYESYLRGRHLWAGSTEQGLREALSYFEAAIATDPSYAPSYAGVADVCGQQGFLGALAPAEAFPRLQTAARKALELDPTSAEAHASLGYALALYDWSWAAGEKELKRAIELNPSYAMARLFYFWYLMMQRRLDEAHEQIQRARELDPLSFTIRIMVGQHLLWARRYADAISYLEPIVALEPNQAMAQWTLGVAYAKSGRFAEATSSLGHGMAIGTNCQAWLGHVHARAGETEKALNVLSELEESGQRRDMFPRITSPSFTSARAKTTTR